MVAMLWEKIENILDEKIFVAYEKSFENCLTNILFCVIIIMYKTKGEIMNELEKELSEKVAVAVAIFNSEKGQELVKKLRVEYLKSKKAKHTKQEWDELKQRLIVDCVLNYYLQDEKAKEHLGELVYKELKEKGEK